MENCNVIDDYINSSAVQQPGVGAVSIDASSLYSAFLQQIGHQSSASGPTQSTNVQRDTTSSSVQVYSKERPNINQINSLPTSTQSSAVGLTGAPSTADESNYVFNDSLICKLYSVPLLSLQTGF